MKFPESHLNQQVEGGSRKRKFYLGLRINIELFLENVEQKLVVISFIYPDEGMRGGKSIFEQKSRMNGCGCLACFHHE